MSAVRRLVGSFALAGLALAGAACSSAESPFASSTPTVASGATASAVLTARPAGGSVENGKALFTTLGCVACHSTGSNVIIGPGLAGVTTRSGEAQIRQSITDPAAVITEGFQNLMPPTFATLSESDLGDLVAYLGTLR